MNRRLYWLHRWISAIALAQLGLWSISGLFFAAVPMHWVKGQPVARGHAAPLTSEVDVVPPATIIAKLQGRGDIDRVELVGTPDGPVYRTVGTTRARFDARTGAERPIDSKEAAQIAQRDQPGSPSVREVMRIETHPPIEYRGKPLPAWRVQLGDDDATAVYIDALTGEVTARRNDTWRTYDLLWSLHIMDYGARESLNHPLLVFAAGIAALTVASGAVLWVLRYRRWFSRRG